MVVLVAVSPARSVTTASTTKLTLSMRRVKLTSRVRRPSADAGQPWASSSFTSAGARMSTRPGAFSAMLLFSRVVVTLAEP